METSSQLVERLPMLLGKWMVASIIVGGACRDDVADPAECPAAADPQAGGDDEPHDGPQNPPVVDLPEPRDDGAEDGGDPGIPRGRHSVAFSMDGNGCPQAGLEEKVTVPSRCTARSSHWR